MQYDEKYLVNIRFQVSSRAKYVLFLLLFRFHHVNVMLKLSLTSQLMLVMHLNALLFQSIKLLCKFEFSNLFD